MRFIVCAVPIPNWIPQHIYSQLHTTGSPQQVSVPCLHGFPTFSDTLSLLRPLFYPFLNLSHTSYHCRASPRIYQDGNKQWTKFWFFFQIISLISGTLIAVSFPLVETPRKLLFWYGLKLLCYILFNVIHTLKSYSTLSARSKYADCISFRGIKHPPKKKGMSWVWY